MRYKEIVKQIQGLSWHLATVEDLLALMVLSKFAAEEYAQSLKIALLHHPLSVGLERIKAGEIRTDNLQFAEYDAEGDHYEFLEYFINKYDVLDKCSVYVQRAGEEYLRQIRSMSTPIRVMSVISRECELSEIFTSMLKAEGWDELPELRAYRYYLERHIVLDSGADGHGEILKSEFKVTDMVVPYYEARWNMYGCIPSLTSTR